MDLNIISILIFITITWQNIKCHENDKLNLFFGKTDLLFFQVYIYIYIYIYIFKNNAF